MRYSAMPRRNASLGLSGVVWWSGISGIIWINHHGLREGGAVSSCDAETEYAPLTLRFIADMCRIAKMLVKRSEAQLPPSLSARTCTGLETNSLVGFLPQPKAVRVRRTMRGNERHRSRVGENKGEALGI